MDKIASVETLKSITTFDLFGGPGGSHGGTRNIYLDATWEYVPQSLRISLTSVRCNEKSPQHVQFLSRAEAGMENFYVVNNKCPQVQGSFEGASSAPTPPGSAPPTPEETSLGKQYLYALTRYHGPSLKRLLLSDQWVLSQDDLGDLVRHCPNLEQLGLAISSAQHNILRMLLPFLPKLRAVRLLTNDSLNEHLRAIPNERRIEGMSRDMWKTGVKQLRWIGVGDYIYRTGKTYSVSLKGGGEEWRREIIPAQWEDVKDVEIWRMDSLDLDADPVMPFEP